MKYSFSAAMVAISRRISALLPRVTAVGGDDLEAVKERCRESYARWGHCENPYPVGDVRRSVWIAETHEIVSGRLGATFRDPTEVTHIITAAPEQGKGARLIRWNGEDVYV